MYVALVLDLVCRKNLSQAWQGWLAETCQVARRAKVRAKSAEKRGKYREILRAVEGVRAYYPGMGLLSLMDMRNQAWPADGSPKNSGGAYEKGFLDRESKMEIMVMDCCPTSYTKEI